MSQQLFFTAGLERTCSILESMLDLGSILAVPYIDCISITSPYIKVLSHRAMLFLPTCCFLLFFCLEHAFALELALKGGLGENKAGG